MFFVVNRLSVSTQSMCFWPSPMCNYVHQLWRRIDESYQILYIICQIFLWFDLVLTNWEKTNFEVRRRCFQKKASYAAYRLCREATSSHLRRQRLAWWLCLFLCGHRWHIWPPRMPVRSRQPPPWPPCRRRRRLVWRLESCPPPSPLCRSSGPEITRPVGRIFYADYTVRKNVQMFELLSSILGRSCKTNTLQGAAHWIAGFCQDYVHTADYLSSCTVQVFPK